MLCKQTDYMLRKNDCIKSIINIEAINSIEIVNVEHTEYDYIEKIEALYYSFPITLEIDPLVFSSRLNNRSFDIFLNTFEEKIGGRDLYIYIAFKYQLSFSKDIFKILEKNSHIGLFHILYNHMKNIKLKESTGLIILRHSAKKIAQFAYFKK